MKHTICKKVSCPFYKHEDSQVIYCEGTEKGSTIHMAFETRRYALDYKEAFCRSEYKKCEIYKMLEDIYERKTAQRS